MTTEDKLDYFMSTIVEDAGQRSQKTLDDYRKGLDSIFESFSQESLRKQNEEIKASRENLHKEINMELADCQMKFRKKLGEKQEELKALLFRDVERRLGEYKKTQDYYAYLAGHIEKALHFARKEAIEIYLDPEDAELQGRLEQDTGAEVRISEYGFGGGVRAVIRSKRVLIDQSFETKLQEAEKEFLFHLR